MEHWPQSPEEFDEIFLGQDSVVETFVQTGKAIDDCTSQVATQIRKFLLSRHPGGPVLVKTSTAGSRSLTHEPHVNLLSCVLSAARSSLPTERIILADGTAFGESYFRIADEASWTRVASQTDVELVDLNETEADWTKSGWPVSSIFTKCPTVILVGKAKTHRRFGVSLVEKSVLGALSGRILGYPKLAGRHDHVTSLVDELLQIPGNIYSIIDGFGGIDREGPLAGTVTDSRFLVHGRGTVGPELRAIVEMGFDPCLVPSQCRPRKSVIPNPQPNRQRSDAWAQLRVSGVDFYPARSCAWLYRSLYATMFRRRRYKNLLKGARRCWPKPT